MRRIHDLIGIGFGPNNIGLAVHLHERALPGDALFLEARDAADWHPGMLLDSADIQHASARDFISPIQPRSHFSFLNYLKSHDRLLEHFNTPAPFPLRKEWSGYVRWVAEHFLHQVRFGARVSDIRLIEHEGETVYQVRLDDGDAHFGRALSLATGQTPNVPELFRPHLGKQVFHLSAYRDRLDRLCKVFRDLRVAVIGASQSAVEILLDLHRRREVGSIHCAMRSFALRQKDLSPFTEHVFFPDVVQWFQGLDEHDRATINAQLGDAVYARADKDALDALYRAQYEDRLDGVERLRLHPYTEATTLCREEDGLRLTLTERHGGAQRLIDVDAVVLATGFRRLGPEAGDEKTPALLEGLADRLEREPSGCVRIGADYSLAVHTDAGTTLPVYLNGLAVSSHGIGDAGSFPLLAYRADRIAWSLAGRRQQRPLRVSA